MNTINEGTKRMPNDETLKIGVEIDNSKLKKGVQEVKQELASIPDKITIGTDVLSQIKAITAEAKALSNIVSKDLKDGLFDVEDAKLVYNYMDKLADITSKINIYDGSADNNALIQSATELVNILESGNLQINTDTIDKAAQSFDNASSSATNTAKSVSDYTDETHTATGATEGVVHSVQAVQDSWLGAIGSVRQYIATLGKIPDMLAEGFDPTQYSETFQAMYQSVFLAKNNKDELQGSLDSGDVSKEEWIKAVDAYSLALSRAAAQLNYENLLKNAGAGVPTGTTPTTQPQQKQQQQKSNSSDIGKTIKSIVTGITGIATVFALVRRIASQNEALTSAITNAIDLIATIMEPLFNWLANIINTVVSWFGKILGFEIKTSKATSSVAKSLASFDEINNLNSGSTGTNSSSSNIVKVRELEDFDGFADDIVNKIGDVYGENSKIYQWLTKNITTDEEGNIENPYTYRQRRVAGIGNQNDSEGGISDWLEKIWKNQTTTTQQQITAQKTIVDELVTSISNKLETIRKIFSGEGATGEDNPYTYRNRSVFGLGDQNSTSIDWNSVWERIKISVAYGFAQGVSDKSMMDELEQRMYNAQLKAMSKAKQTINFSVDGKNLARVVVDKLGYANEIKGAYITN